MGIIQSLKKLNKTGYKKKFFYNFYRETQNLPLKFQKTNFKKHKTFLPPFLYCTDKFKTKKKRDELVMYLKKNKIGCGINYRSVTDMSVFRKNLVGNYKNL